MANLLHLHDGLPSEVANVVMRVTSPKRRSRRVNIYKLAETCKLYVKTMRDSFTPFEDNGLLEYVGSGAKLLGKIQIGHELEQFWRCWVVPSLEPASSARYLDVLSKKSLRTIFHDNTLRPLTKELSRKPKEFVIGSLFYRIFQTQDSFEGYQNSCMESLSSQQKDFLAVLDKSGLSLSRAQHKCGFDQRLLGSIIETLSDRWLIRLIWQNQDGQMRWTIVRLTYDSLTQDIRCGVQPVSDLNDGTMRKMLTRFNSDANDMSDAGETRRLLWEYYFERVDKEWHTFSAGDFDTFRPFMECWHDLFGQDRVRGFDIRSGIYRNPGGKVALLLIRGESKRYVGHAINWDLMIEDELGLGLTSLGVSYADNMRQANGIRAIWARNQNRLTIILPDSMKFLRQGWVERIAQFEDGTRYVVTPKILGLKNIGKDEVLSIIGSIIPLAVKQEERLSLWCNMMGRV